MSSRFSSGGASCSSRSYPRSLVVLSGVFSPVQSGDEDPGPARAVDPVVTSHPNATQVLQEETTESELNSEVELLNSQDLLRQVVLANELQPGALPALVLASPARK